MELDEMRFQARQARAVQAVSGEDLGKLKRLANRREWSAEIEVRDWEGRRSRSPATLQCIDLIEPPGPNGEKGIVELIFLLGRPPGRVAVPPPERKMLTKQERAIRDSAIRELHARGLSGQQIARELGVSENTVSRAKRGGR